MSIRAIPALILAALAASPALAQAATQGTAIPEPSSMVLFGLGLAGLAIGRHFSGRRPRD